jgi:hypothetical protein
MDLRRVSLGRQSPECSEPAPSRGVAGRDYLTSAPRPPWSPMRFRDRCYYLPYGILAPGHSWQGALPLRVVVGSCAKDGTRCNCKPNHSRPVDRNAATSCKARPCTVVRTHSRGGERRWCYRPRGGRQGSRDCSSNSGYMGAPSLCLCEPDPTCSHRLVLLVDGSLHLDLTCPGGRRCQQE